MGLTLTYIQVHYPKYWGSFNILHNRPQWIKLLIHKCTCSFELTFVFKTDWNQQWNSVILLHPCCFSFQKDKLFNLFANELTVRLTSWQGGGAREPADRQPDGPQQPLHPGGPREQLLSHVCTKKRQQIEKLKHKPQKHYCMSRGRLTTGHHQPGSWRLGGAERGQEVTDWPHASCPPGGASWEDEPCWRGSEVGGRGRPSISFPCTFFC